MSPKTKNWIWVEKEDYAFLVNIEYKNPTTLLFHIDIALVILFPLLNIML